MVDDSVTVCNVLEEFLRSRGYGVYTALDGPTAIAKVKELRPHIVLLDIIMPGMGGIEVLKEIKRIDPFMLQWMRSGSICSIRRIIFKGAPGVPILPIAYNSK